MLPFDGVFKELARREVGVIYAHEDPTLPDGTYVFREFLCGESHCECRRVDLRVQQLETARAVAGLTYRFEPQGILGERAGQVTLDSEHPQSELANAVLAVFWRMMEWDPAYATQLARHHALWRKVRDDRLHPDHERLREVARSGAGDPGRPSCGIQ